MKRSELRRIIREEINASKGGRRRCSLNEGIRTIPLSKTHSFMKDFRNARKKGDDEKMEELGDELVHSMEGAEVEIDGKYFSEIGEGFWNMHRDEYVLVGLDEDGNLDEHELMGTEKIVIVKGNKRYR